MARGIIHNKGPKVSRDREKLMKVYDSFCRAFPWYAPLPAADVAKLSNFRLNALCAEVWSDQSPETQLAYMANMKNDPKSVVEYKAPLKFRPLIIPKELQEELNGQAN